MKHFLTVRIEAVDIPNLIRALDGGVAASLELGEKERTAEAPDGSGRYCFKLEDEMVVPFSDLYNDGDIKALTEKIKTLEEENKKLKEDFEDTTEKAEDAYLEIKELEAKVSAKPAQRLRAY